MAHYLSLAAPSIGKCGIRARCVEKNPPKNCTVLAKPNFSTVLKPSDPRDIKENRTAMSAHAFAFAFAIACRSYPTTQRKAKPGIAAAFFEMESPAAAATYQVDVNQSLFLPQALFFILH